MKNYVVKVIRFVCMKLNIKATDIFVLRNAAGQMLPKDEQVAISRRVYL